MTSTEIIANAHSWLETKFKHQGRVKISADNKGGCDCLGLIMGLNLKTKLGEDLKLFDQLEYPKLMTSNALQEQLDLLLEPSSEIRLGSVILIKINNWPQHLAVVVELKPYITIIHSYLQARKVVKQHLPKEWEVVRIYTKAEEIL